MKNGVLFFLIGFNICYAQTDWVKWNAVEISYELPSIEIRNFKIDNGNVGSTLLTGAVKTYHVLISDIDGDNCPFYPSCSEFFIQSVKSTNVLAGILMFADRFTRDTNFFKNRAQYPFHSSGKLYDPAVNYTLKFNNINHIPYD